MLIKKLFFLCSILFIISVIQATAGGCGSKVTPECELEIRDIQTPPSKSRITRAASPINTHCPNGELTLSNYGNPSRTLEDWIRRSILHAHCGLSKVVFDNPELNKSTLEKLIRCYYLAGIKKLVFKNMPWLSDDDLIRIIRTVDNTNLISFRIINCAKITGEFLGALATKSARVEGDMIYLNGIKSLYFKDLHKLEPKHIYEYFKYTNREMLQALSILQCPKVTGKLLLNIQSYSDFINLRSLILIGYKEVIRKNAKNGEILSAHDFLEYLIKNPNILPILRILKLSPDTIPGDRDRLLKKLTKCANRNPKNIQLTLACEGKGTIYTTSK